MRTLSRVTAPTVEPISLDALQEWMPQQAGKDEGKILGLISAATCEIENVLLRSLNTQTWEFAIDAVHIEDCIELPRPPLISIASDGVKTYDTGNNEFVVPSSHYTIEVGDTSRIWLNIGEVWQGNVVWGADFRPKRSLVVKYVSGYGPLPTDIPAEIRKAIKELVTLDYWHPLTGRINPDGAAVDDVQAARQEVFAKIAHFQAGWAAL